MQQTESFARTKQDADRFSKYLTTVALLHDAICSVTTVVDSEQINIWEKAVSVCLKNMWQDVFRKSTQFAPVEQLLYRQAQREAKVKF